MTFAEQELIKVSGMVKAMDNGQLVYTIAQIMESTAIHPAAIYPN